MSLNRPRARLPLIVFAQLAGTSLWFAGNAVADPLMASLDLPAGALGPITSSVQLGFIAGTLIFAILTIADRFSPSLVFFVCAVAGGLTNLGLLFEGMSYSGVLLTRFMTGVFLAGIYPVGMKIAADHFSEGLGRALGFLLAALVLGTAFPHLLKSILAGFPWRYVLVGTSLFAALGGLIILALVPDGPGRIAMRRFDHSVFWKVFSKRDFRNAAFGYFGHMWELYAFWAFVPVIIANFALEQKVELDVALASFFIIASGAIGCVLGGIVSTRKGSAYVARLALAVSGIFCLLSPLFLTADAEIFWIGLVVWGVAVIADSPQFSTLVAQTAPAESKATALTIVNCIGFSITIASIQLINMMALRYDVRWIFTILAIGPAIGLIAMSRSRYDQR